MGSRREKVFKGWYGETPEEAFKRLVTEVLKPVHQVLGEALGRLAEQGIQARTYFNARDGV